MPAPTPAPPRSPQPAPPPGGRLRPTRRARVLLGLVVVGALVAGGLGVVRALRTEPECTVTTADGEVGLSRDEARRATTAVATAARGLAGPDASDVDGEVLRRLGEGPPEDAGPSLTCRGAAADDLPVEELTETGLTPRAERVRVAMAEVFGDQSLGGFARGGVDHGHQPGSTHYEGRAIDVFFRPVTEENRRAGWLLAHWLVAHADELAVQHVIFDDRVWSVRRPDGRWADYEASDPTNEILRHLDHVHVDVLRGGPG